VPELLAGRLPGAECRSLPFMFEGGDLLSDETHLYAAPNFLARNQPFGAGGHAHLLSAVESHFGKKAVCVGGTVSDAPAHHIGMYLTPLGNGTLAAGDPDLGLRMYERLKVAGVDVERDTSKYEPFRRVIRTLEDRGFDVVRVPLILTRADQVYVTYNNAILETRNGAKRIFMPVYGLPALDSAAGRIFEEQGWTVIPIRVAGLYRHTGSLRCLVGILRRSRA
jgi:hypothetical protein